MALLVALGLKMPCLVQVTALSVEYRVFQKESMAMNLLFPKADALNFLSVLVVLDPSPAPAIHSPLLLLATVIALVTGVPPLSCTAISPAPNFSRAD